MGWNYNINDIQIILLSVLISLSIGYLINKLFRNAKNPKGRKTGIVHYDILIGFSLVSSVLYVYKDWLYSIILLFVFYLLLRQKYKSKEIHVYQVILTLFISILPLSSYIFYKEGYYHKLFKQKSNQESSYQVIERMNEDDQRQEAIDNGSEYNLEKFEKGSSSSFDSDIH